MKRKRCWREKLTTLDGAISWQLLTTIFLPVQTTSFSQNQLQFFWNLLNYWYSAYYVKIIRGIPGILSGDNRAIIRRIFLLFLEIFLFNSYAAKDNDWMIEWLNDWILLTRQPIPIRRGGPKFSNIPCALLTSDVSLLFSKKRHLRTNLTYFFVENKI